MKIKNNDFEKGYDPLEDIINSLEDKCGIPMEESVNEYNKYLIQMYQDFIDEPLKAACFIEYLQDNFNESSCLKFKIWFADYFLNLTIDEKEANIYCQWDGKMTALLMDKALYVFKPNHPQTQGKIERYHRSMKNIVKLENYYFPEQLKERLAEFVEYYNNHRYHESLNNLTPTDVYHGRAESILKQRELIKQRTMKRRRKDHLNQMLNL